MPSRSPSSRKSVWRRRKSTLSLPSPRISRAASVISSSVECGDTSAPTEAAPCLSTTSETPLATNSSAVCQSTFLHSPFCFTIGETRRSSLFSASYEKRSRSAIQHSLTGSFSSGSTRSTRLFFTCTIRLLPRLSCGDTLLRRDSSQLRASKRNGFDVSAPTGQMSIMLPDSSESTVRPTNARISACSPRPAMPSSMMPPISMPKRMQRVQWMQRVISSAEMSGPMYLWKTTRFFSR